MFIIPKECKRFSLSYGLWILNKSYQDPMKQILGFGRPKLQRLWVIYLQEKALSYNIGISF
jgi:hypothetical protein